MTNMNRQALSVSMLAVAFAFVFADASEPVRDHGAGPVRVSMGDHSSVVHVRNRSTNATLKRKRA
jgi:hypothetical protein